MAAALLISNHYLRLRDEETGSGGLPDLLEVKETSEGQDEGGSGPPLPGCLLC